MFGSGGRRRLGGGRLIIAAIMIVVALLGYFGSSQVNPVTGQTQHVNMSPQEETAMGLQAAPEMEAQFGGLSSNQQATALVERVGNQVWQHSDAASGPYQFQYHLLADQQTINAFALPGRAGLHHRGAHVASPDRRPACRRAGTRDLARHPARTPPSNWPRRQLTQGVTGAAVIAAVNPNDPRHLPDRPIRDAREPDGQPQIQPDRRDRG